MIPRERILEKLESFFSVNDTAGAKRLLEYWLSEARGTGDEGGVLWMENELMGLCRKLGEEEKALWYAEAALEQVERMGISENVGAATTYLNAATVYKAFGMANKAIGIFEKAKRIYETSLSPEDPRLAGLYNNMALALVDEKDFCRAEALYSSALSVLEKNEGSEPEVAITYLNLATLVETKKGQEAGREEIGRYLKKAWACLDLARKNEDANYAFVCDKCASVFGYYGFEDYARELKERSRRIYEGA